jgi:hypothetical protein
MQTLNREKLLKAKVDVPQETVDLPEFKGSVIVRGMTGKEQSSFHKNLRGATKTKVEVDEDTFTAKLVVHCMVDDKGDRMLKDDEWELVYDWPTLVFNRITAAAMRVNGLSAGN